MHVAFSDRTVAVFTGDVVVAPAVLIAALDRAGFAGSSLIEITDANPAATEPPKGVARCEECSRL